MLSSAIIFLFIAFVILIVAFVVYRKTKSISVINYIASIATIISVFLAASFYCFDGWQRKNEQVKLDQKAIFIIKEEIKSNIKRLRDNKNVLQTELNTTGDKIYNITTIVSLEANSSIIHRFYLPPKIMKNEALILLLRYLSDYVT